MLFWVSDKCGNVEPVVDDSQIGDVDECVHCERPVQDACEATVVEAESLEAIKREKQETDATRGFYRKFNVTRTDGSSAPGGKHEYCSYFVLDLDHDAFAIPALKSYATACRKTHPALADDIEQLVSSVERGMGRHT